MENRLAFVGRKSARRRWRIASPFPGESPRHSPGENRLTLRWRIASPFAGRKSPRRRWRIASLFAGRKSPRCCLKSAIVGQDSVSLQLEENRRRLFESTAKLSE
ncbi:unnamed protein product [Linum trigynum]|uniref:Uncharacterized protein n=1 Tax=Linum trigynum TaxID=586398 RepID=A0AAV2DZP9_9ROSI